TQVLRQLPFSRDRNVLVGSAAADDAGVFRLDKKRALVQTVDFFTPIVDDAFQYGEIAAANALSDVFAMGGRPLTGLNIVGMPDDKIDSKTVATILRGGLSKAREANCAVVGGHTVRAPEPLYGMAVTGVVDPRKMLTNANARPGDVLVLTKPLGTGIVTTAIKRNLTSSALARKAIASMSQLNSVGTEISRRGLAHAATDITGFGLLGHLASMCRASKVRAEISVNDVPAISNEVFDLIARDCVPGGTRDNLNAADAVVEWDGTSHAQRVLLADAQTSGGLLLSVPEINLRKLVKLLQTVRTPCAVVIGRVVRPRRGGSLICITK
ncbi:MAG TPA: selenide, water dikinase SelD, partial [Chthoniobacterales bacterium]|nr:selenide, water dikinase SelD [Chthoniobacterales bacterium]